MPIAKKKDIREVPVSVLAYIGDAVYELYVRLFLFEQSSARSGALHRQSIEWVSAAAQARAVQELMPQLSDAEAAIFRRGRNSHPSSMPRNAKPAEYQDATGLEALIGYLYLSEEKGRIQELIDHIFTSRKG